MSKNRIQNLFSQTTKVKPHSFVAGVFLFGILLTVYIYHSLIWHGD